MRSLAFALLLLPAAALSQAADPCLTISQSAGCYTLITTHATATTRIPNTAVDVTVGIIGSAKDLPSVQTTLSTQAEKLFNYLRGQRAQRLITTDVSFSPDVRSQKNAPDKTVGYNGTLHLSFRLTAAQAPDVLGGVLDNGANTIDQTTFTPTELEIEAARAQLSAEATKTALAQADAIAKSASMHVVSTRSISVDANGASILPMFQPAPAMMFKVRSSAAIPTASGDQALSMRVDVIVAAAR